MPQVVFQVEEKWLPDGLSLYTCYMQKKKNSAGMSYSICINETYASQFYLIRLFFCFLKAEYLPFK